MSAKAAIVVLLFVAMDVAVISAIIYTAVRTYWSPIADRFPPRPVAEDAIHKRFQSFGAVILNLTWCIHVAADGDYLHLSPALSARLIGIRPASIPWEAIEPVRPSRPGRRIRRAVVAGITLDMPRWCLELVAPRE